MTPNVEMAKSFLRIAVTAALAAYLTIGQAPWDITADGWRGIAAAGVAAATLTAYNWLRPGDTRFGFGSPGHPVTALLDGTLNDVETPNQPVQPPDAG
jgi:hypothetical protein